jgi:hypothetical protein
MPRPYDFTAFFGKAEVQFQAPSTIEEFDNQAGETGAALDEAISNVVYRHTAPRLYKAASAAIAAEPYKFPKAQATGKDGSPSVRVTKEKPEGVPVMESDTAHLSRFYEQGTDEQKAQLVSLLQSTALSLPFIDQSEPAARAGGATKVSKGALDAANGYVAAGPEKVEAVVSYIEGQVPGYKARRDEDGSVSAENLGRAIDALGKHEQAKAKAAAQAALSALG